MKIAIVVSTYPPYRGGMGNVAAQHATALTKAGHTVTVLAPDIGLRPVFRFGNAAWVPQLLWRLREFDCVELHYPFFGGAEWVWLWKKTFGKNKRLVVLYHMDTAGKGVLAVAFRAYRAVFLQPILRAASRILVTSRDYFSASQASDFAADSKVREVPLAVDTERFRSDESMTKEKTILFVGALDRAHYFKGLSILIEAFTVVQKRLPDAKLVVIGDGELRHEAEQSVRDRKIFNTQFLGKVSEDDLPLHYRKALVHVLPSIDRSEAFGLVTLEAAASGVPSVVSDLPGVRSIVEPGITGLHVPPNDPEKLAAALLTLLSDPSRANEMGHAAHARALTRYSHQAVDRLLIDAVTG